MKNHHLYAVILAGGSGTRFWPLSRKLIPKQFLRIIGDRSLFEETVSRIRPRVAAKNIFIVTNRLYQSKVAQEIKKFGVPKSNILSEPEGKNTAPAIGWAAARIWAKDKNAVMLVLPSDHLIQNKGAFLRDTDRAVSLARKNYLVTIGIAPTRPETGYGYLKTVKTKAGGRVIWRVVKFVEKPSLPKAKKFIKEKHYLWNGGIFAWKAGVILSEFKKRLPVIYRAFQKKTDAKYAARIWPSLPAISVDYGILEKAKGIVTVPAKKVDWSDVGSWDALVGILTKGKNKNTLKGNVLDIGSKDICVIGDKRLIVTVGLENTIVVDTPDALLLCRRNLSQKIRDAVALLKKNRRGRNLL